MSVSPAAQVSVAVCAYNAAQTLPRCLDSVLAQSCRALEILVADDGSEDETRAVAEAYAARDARIRVLPGEHGGVSAARNRCLRAATGEWLTFVDADDCLTEDAVDCLTRLARQTGAELCMAGYRQRYGHREKQIHVAPALLNERDELQRYFLTGGRHCAFPWGKLYHRRLYSALSYPEGQIYEDIRVLPRLLERTNALAVLDRPVYVYCLRPGSLTGSPDPALYTQALEARAETADFIRARHPRLAPLLGDYLAEVGLYVLGKAAKSGPREREAAENAVRAALQGVRARHLVYRGALSLFRLAPRLTGRLCARYSAAKNGL